MRAAGVVAVARQLMLVNTNAPATVDFAGTRTGFLSHKTYAGKIELAPYGVELLEGK